MRQDEANASSWFWPKIDFSEEKCHGKCLKEHFWTSRFQNVLKGHAPPNLPSGSRLRRSKLASSCSEVWLRPSKLAIQFVVKIGLIFAIFLYVLSYEFGHQVSEWVMVRDRPVKAQLPLWHVTPTSRLPCACLRFLKMQKKGRPAGYLCLERWVLMSRIFLDNITGKTRGRHFKI